MTKLGIVTGLAFEADIARLAKPSGFELEALCRGPGPENARVAAETLIEGGATALMSFGVAGGLDPALRAGDIVVARSVVESGQQTHHCDLALVNRLAQAANAHTGVLAGVDQPIVTIGEKASLWSNTRAVAVDMESHAVAAKATEAGLPLIVARAIIDPAGQRLPPAVTAGAKPGGGLNISGLLAGLLRRPQDVAAVVRLAGQSRAARRALRNLALVGLPQLFIR